MQENQPRPFSLERTRVIVCKIIFFYSVFYMIMKIMAIFNGAWLKVNLVLMFPFLILSGIGFYNEKRKSYTWFYVILGILIISAIRYYETDLMVWLHNSF